MRRIEIEHWALTVIDAVKRGEPTEDVRVELKAEWPADVQKAARRIAGHANAVGGENILWLIGVDEARGVVGAGFAELANWWPSVESQFDAMAPAMEPLNIPVDGKVVVALLFETDRAPFVVKNPAHNSPNGGPVELEVPWRAGNRVRSAKRADLIRLLVPAQRLPLTETQACTLTLSTSGTAEHPKTSWSLTLTLYIVPRDGATVVIPYHYCDVEFEVQGAVPVTSMSGIRGTDSRPRTVGFGVVKAGQQVTVPQHEMIIDHPMQVSIHGYAEVPVTAKDVVGQDAFVRATLRPVESTRAMIIRSKLHYNEMRELAPSYITWTWHLDTTAVEYSVVEAS